MYSELNESKVDFPPLKSESLFYQKLSNGFVNLDSKIFCRLVSVC